MNWSHINVAAIVIGLSLPAASSGIATRRHAASWLDAEGRVWASAGVADGWIRLGGVDKALAAATSDGVTLYIDHGGELWQWSEAAGSAGPVSGPTDLRKLSCGPNHCLALGAWGSVYQWTPRVSEPKEVPGLVDIVAIAAGADHNLAVSDSGGVYSWGENTFEQLGRGPQAEGLPGVVEGISAALAVSAGDQTSVALLRSGEVVVWGRNDSGQLGVDVARAVLPARLPGMLARSVAASGPRLWVTTPEGALFEVSAPESPTLNADFLGVTATSDGAVAVEEDGSVHWLSALRERFPGTVFEDGMKTVRLRLPFGRCRLWRFRRRHCRGFRRSHAIGLGPWSTPRSAGLRRQLRRGRKC